MILTLCAILLTTFSFGQQFYGAKSTGYGNLAAITFDTDAIFNNQAGLAMIEQAVFSSTVEKRYFWSDVNFAGAGFALPTSSGTFGIDLQAFGFSEFSQQKLGLSYGRIIHESMSIGGQINYHRIAIPEYGNDGAFSFEFGMQAKLADDLLIGVHMQNPFQKGFTDEEKLQTLFQLGMLYTVSEKVKIGVEFEKDIKKEMIIKSGLEYSPEKSILFRAGYSDNPANFHFGFGYVFNDHLQFDIGSKYDLTLGLTTSFGVSYLL
ncbi:MAG: hypothetical protein AAFZ15_25915 [Bacteroidota bacterium]